MKKLLMTAGAAVLALTTAASAATLSISAGATAGNIPGGGETNEVLGPLGLGGSLAGFFGSEIELSGIGPGNSVLVQVLGFEAGFANTFSTAEDSYTSTGGTVVGSIAAPLASWVTDVQSGLNFTFATDGNIANPDKDVANGDSNTNAPNHVNFFAHQAVDGSVFLFFDDTGAGDDDNHDDLVVRLSIVPLPAGALLLLTGVGALALRRRKS